MGNRTAWNALDLTGQRFGRLVVIKKGATKFTSGGNKKVTWDCVCDCGNTSNVSTGELRCKNFTKSCGCYSPEATSKIMKKYNDWYFIDNIAVGITSTGEEFKISIEDYDKLKDFCWRIGTGNRVITNNINNNRKTIKIHHIIIGVPQKGYVVDHIDRDPKNNTRDNLRFVTLSQNGMNKSIQRNNTSGFIGVGYDKKCNNWTAKIKKDNKTVNLGSYKNKDDAIKARLEAEIKYFGFDFSPQRHLFEEYNIYQTKED